MKKILLPLLFVLSIFSCKKKTEKKDTKEELIEIVDTHTAEDSLDWSGSYVGILPCENSCLGVNTEIVLNEDETFTKSMIYMGDNNKEETETGRFLWLKEGSTIALDDKNKTKISIRENAIVELDKDGKEHTGENAKDYILYKNICENKDFEEYKHKGSDGKNYLITYGSNCNGAFAEVKYDGNKEELCLKSSESGRSIFENGNIRLIDDSSKTVLFIKGQEITLTTSN